MFFQKKNQCSWKAHRFKSLVSIELFAWNTITIMGIQDKNTKNSIKSKDCPKSKTPRELEKLCIDTLHNSCSVHRLAFSTSGISWVHRGMFSTSGFSIQYKSKAFMNLLPHMNHDIPRCTHGIPRCAEHTLFRVIDWLVYCYEVKCTVQWAEEHIRNNVCRLSSKPQLTLKLSLVRLFSSTTGLFPVCRRILDL